MSISYIYEILDKSDNPVYIGKADDVESRIGSHISASRKSQSELGKWISRQPIPLKYRVVAKCASSVVNDIEHMYILNAIENGYKVFNKFKIHPSKYIKVPCEVKEYGIIIELPITPEQLQQLERMAITPSAAIRLKSDWFYNAVFELAINLLTNKQKESK